MEVRSGDGIFLEFSKAFVLLDKMSNAQLNKHIM